MFALLAQVGIALTGLDLLNFLMENLVLPAKGTVGRNASVVDCVEIAVTPEELQRLLNSSEGTLFRVANNRAQLFKE